MKRLISKVIYKMLKSHPAIDAFLGTTFSLATDFFGIPDLVVDWLRKWYEIPDPIWKDEVLSEKIEGYLFEAEKIQSYFESLGNRFSRSSSGKGWWNFDDVLARQQREKADRFDWLIETIEKEIKRLLGR